MTRLPRLLIVAALLAPIPLEHIHDYQDLGQRISIMTGRKPVASPGAHDNERRAWRRLP